MSQDRPMGPPDAKVEALSMPNDTIGYQTSKIYLQKPRIHHQGANESAHISVEEFDKTEAKQRKPNKPISHQTDQNLKSRSSAQLSSAVKRQAAKAK